MALDLPSTHLTLEQLIHLWKDEQIFYYQENEKTFLDEYLKSHKNYQKTNEESKQYESLFLEYACHSKTMFTIHDQSNLILNWWNYTIPNIPSAHVYSDGTINNMIITEVMANNFYNKLDAKKCIPIYSQRFGNNPENTKKYNNQSISWFHFALMENWTLAFDMPSYHRDFHHMINLKNSLGENSWHVAIPAMITGARNNSSEMIELIHSYLEDSIFVVDHNNKNVFDLLDDYKKRYTNNVKNNKNFTENKMRLDVINTIYPIFEKIAFYHKLNNQIVNSKPSHKRLKV